MFEQEYYGAYFCTVWCFQHILVAYLVQTQRNIVPRGKKSLVTLFRVERIGNGHPRTFISLNFRFSRMIHVPT